MGRQLIAAGLVVGLMSIFACGRGGTPAASHATPPVPNAEIISLHDSLIMKIIAVKKQYGRWSFMVDNGIFGWDDSLLQEVMDFALRPSAAQFALDDLAEHSTDEDRTLANLQIMYIVLSTQPAVPDKFSDLDGTRYGEAFREGRFNPIIGKYPNLDLRLFFDNTMEKLREIQSERAKLGSRVLVAGTEAAVTRQ